LTGRFAQPVGHDPVHLAVPDQATVAAGDFSVLAMLLATRHATPRHATPPSVRLKIEVVGSSGGAASRRVSTLPDGGFLPLSNR